MFAPDGLKILIAGILLFLLAVLITFFFPWPAFQILSVLLGLGCLFNFYFFRDPQRAVPGEENLVLSPADGTVLKIEKIYEPYYFHDSVVCISIFMSIMSVHVNRIPISGTVDFLKYIKGRFRAAYHDKASEENEQSIIGIRNARHRLLFKQIAGIIARRVVFHLREGQPVKAGERFGLIRYGSRVDIFCDHDVRIRVKAREKVYGGVTIIGEYNG
jgi:phosphatidylserine decarboxylase